CAFNQHVFLNFFKSLKIRAAWRKDFFDTLKSFAFQEKNSFHIKSKKRTSRLINSPAYAPAEAILIRPLHNWETHQYRSRINPKQASRKRYMALPPNHSLLNSYTSRKSILS